MYRAISLFTLLAMTKAVAVETKAETEVATTTQTEVEADCPSCGDYNCGCDGGYGSICG